MNYVVKFRKIRKFFNIEDNTDKYRPVCITLASVAPARAMSVSGGAGVVLACSASAVVVLERPGGAALRPDEII